MSVTAWQGGRQGRLLEIALWAALAVVGLFGVLLPLLGVTGPVSPMSERDVQIDAVTRVHGAVASGPVTLHGTHQAEIAVAHPDAGQRIMLALPDMVDGALLFLILALLLRMVITLRDGDVFVPKNIGRLNIIAAAIVAMGVISPWVRALTTHLLISGTDVSPAIPLAFSVQASPILLGLLVAALAETFRRGAKLRADTEGLI